MPDDPQDSPTAPVPGAPYVPVFDPYSATAPDVQTPAILGMQVPYGQEYGSAPPEQDPAAGTGVEEDREKEEPSRA